MIDETSEFKQRKCFSSLGESFCSISYCFKIMRFITSWNGIIIPEVTKYKGRRTGFIKGRNYWTLTEKKMLENIPAYIRNK